jgi:hypothetical protein
MLARRKSNPGQLRCRIEHAEKATEPYAGAQRASKPFTAFRGTRDWLLSRQGSGLSRVRSEVCALLDELANVVSFRLRLVEPQLVGSNYFRGFKWTGLNRRQLTSIGLPSKWSSNGLQDRCMSIESAQN